MRIGVHPNNLHLRLARLWPGAFADLDADFVTYDEGRDTASLLEDGRIHVGGTGSTPPIEADARGLDVRYLAASAPRPANGAILALTDGPVRGVADLAGRRVSLVDGSFQTYLLARSLEAEGLGLRDVVRVESGKSDGLKALLAGEVDAWVAMSPRLEKVVDRADLSVVVACGSLIPNRSLFWTLERHAIAPGIADAFVAELSRFGREVGADPARAAALLAAEPGSEGDAASWERVLRARDFSVVSAGPAIIGEQQAEADTLFSHGHLGRRIALAAAASAHAHAEASA